MDLESLSASALAYVGDAVFSLFTRVYLANKYDYKSGELTLRANKIVSARNQAHILTELEGELFEEDAAIVKRCRNSHTFGFAKNASVSEYRRATGLEGLLGYLYLKKDPRLDEILNRCIQISVEKPLVETKKTSGKVDEKAAEKTTQKPLDNVDNSITKIE